LCTVFGEVAVRKAEAFSMLVSGLQPYINCRKKLEIFPIYFNCSITSVAKLSGRPSQNGGKYNEGKACNKHVATSQLLTNSDPHTLFKQNFVKLILILLSLLCPFLPPHTPPPPLLPLSLC
jgi:hypothetical protein